MLRSKIRVMEYNSVQRIYTREKDEGLLVKGERNAKTCRLCHMLRILNKMPEEVFSVRLLKDVTAIKLIVFK